MHATPWVDYYTVAVHTTINSTTLADVVQVGAACTLQNATWYTTVVLRLPTVLLLILLISTTADHTLIPGKIYRLPHGIQRGQTTARYHGLGHDYYTVTIHHRNT